MDHEEIRKYWNENADAWTELTRMGYDLARIHLNTPAFMKMLPDVKGLRGLDIGCGEGTNTRIVAERGAKLAAIDIADKFIEHARATEKEKPLGIEYIRASATDLPFADGEFDFAVSFMAMMDVGDIGKVLAEVRRVLKPGGFFQFSVLHPCFMPPYRKWFRNEKGEREALMVSDYFNEADGTIDEWMFNKVPEELKAKYPNFRTPRFHRTVSTWVNSIVEAGLTIERFVEPSVDDENLRAQPGFADTRLLPETLHVRIRKP